VSFFLDGVTEAAAIPKAGPASYRLFEMLPMMPRFTVERVRQRLDTTFPTANAALKVMENLGIVMEQNRSGRRHSSDIFARATVSPIHFILPSIRVRNSLAPAMTGDSPRF
jgi:hypothetical protein